MEWAELLKWPITTIAIVIFLTFFFKSSLAKLISSINKLKVGKLDADIAQVNQEPDKSALANPNPTSTTNVPVSSLPIKKDSLDYINRILSFFSPLTIENYKSGIESEINLSKVTDRDEKLELLYLYSQALVINLNFERIYSKIFGSQLYLLEDLNTGGGANRQSLKRYYDDAAAQYPEIYRNYDYGKYLLFLLDVQLIINKNENIEITTIGRDFLKYLVETGKTMIKHY